MNIKFLPLFAFSSALALNFNLKKDLLDAIRRADKFHNGMMKEIFPKLFSTSSTSEEIDEILNAIISTNPRYAAKKY